MKQRKLPIIVRQRLLLLLMLALLAGFRAGAATVYFNKVFQGAGTSYTQSSSRINNISLLAGAGFQFTSVNPDAPSFQYDAGGNNISGTLSYVNSSGTVISISGIISRLDKGSGVVSGLYFVNPAAGTAYLLVIPGYESRYSAGSNVNTSSESALEPTLNNTVAEQSNIPLLSIADTSALENAGYMVFKITVNPAATSAYSFTPTLTAGSATAPSDFTASMEYNSGNDWQTVSGAISLAASVTSLLIRVPLTDNNIIEANETFILNTGAITGGGFLNHHGTYAQATILDDDGTPAPITQPDITYTYGHASFVLSPTSANTTGVYSYSITGSGAVITQQNGSFTVIGTGTTQVTIYQAPGSGYGQGSLVINVTVVPAPLEITAISKSKVYDGISFSGGNGVSYSGFVYNETASVLSGTISYGGAAQGAKNVGTYALMASGQSSANYNITYVPGTLEITKAPLDITAADYVKTYDGQAYSGGNGVSFSGFVGGENMSVLSGSIVYGGAAQGAKNVGAHPITPSGFSALNYNINYVNGTLTINRAPLTIAAAAQSKVYDGQVFGGAHAVSYSGFVGSDNQSNALSGTLSYTGNWQSATGVGTYDIVPGGYTAANYTIDFVNSTLIINPARLTATVGSKTKTYDGQIYQGGYSIAYQGFVNGETAATATTGSVAYGGTAPPAINADTYTITAGGLSAANYTIVYVPGTLTISKATLVITANNAAKTYDAQAFSGGNGVSYSGFAPGESPSILQGTIGYGGAAQGAVNTGTYALTASGVTALNYNIDYLPGSLSIQPAPLEATAASVVKTYDAQAFSGGNGVSYSGFVGGETSAVLSGNIVYSGAAQGAKNVGTYILSASGVSASNYTINYVAGTLTINAAPLTITAVAQSKIYNGQAFGGTHAVTYSGFVSGETAADLNGNIVYNGNWQTATGTGTYTIIPAGQTASNYSINYAPGTLAIHPAPLTATVDSKSKIYDGQVYSSGYSIAVVGFVAGETYATTVTGTVSYGGSAQTAVNAGTYVINASGLAAANYTITYTDGALTIHKALLAVEAQDAVKTYDGQAYTGGNVVQYSGFAPGENASVLSGQIAYGGTAQQSVNTGTYTITVGGLSADNYLITYTDGTLIINAAVLTATVASYTKTYDGTAYNGGSGITYSGFVAGETAAIMSGSLVYSGTAQGAVNAGNYVLSASGQSAPNYTINYVDGTLTINRAPLTIAAAAQSKVYDGQVFGGAHAVSYSGFVGSDNQTNALSGTLSYTGNWQSATGVGTYDIVPGGYTAANYTIDFVNSTLAVHPALLKATVDNKAKTYDGGVFGGAYTVSLQGFVNGENASVLIGQLTYGGTAPPAINAGTYTITAGGLSAANYTIVYVPGTLTISKATLVITANNAAKTYDAQAYSGGNDISYTGFVGGETSAVLSGNIAYGGTAQGAKNVGAYTLSAGGLSAANYNISYADGTLQITKAPLVITAADYIKTYDAQAYGGGNGVSYAGFVYNETASVLSGTISYGGAAQGAVNTGTYALTASGQSSANYTITYVHGKLTINPAVLTITAAPQSKIYDGQLYNGPHAVTYSGFVGGENTSVLNGTISYTGAWQGAVHAGTYTIIPTGQTASNYRIIYTPGGLVINKAPLLITANDQAKTYDGRVFPASGHAVGYKGFVGGEGPGHLSGTLVYGGTAQAATGAGSYAITPAGLQSADYNISFADGRLTINKAPLVVTANAQSKTYDGRVFPASGYTVSYSGFVAGDGAVNAVSGTVAYSGTAKNAVNAGTYVIIPGGLAAANYAIRFENGPLTIAKAAPLILAFPDMVRTYGDPDFVLTPPQSNSTGAFSYSGSNDGVGKTGGVKITITGVGTALVTATQAPDSNYNAAAISAVLTVKKARLVVKANPAFRCIGKANPELTYSMSGFVKKENKSVLNRLPEIHTDATDTSAAGAYAITASGGEAANYSFSYLTAILRVNKPLHQPAIMTPVDIVAGDNAQLAARPFGIDYQWSPAIGLSAPTSAMTSVNPRQDQDYTVRITENTGCVIMDKVKVRVFSSAGVYVPTGFTPNGDGNNDVLRVVGPGVQTLQYFRVFNRWGQLVFETTEIGKGWDGRFKGMHQPQDTYVWVLMAAEKSGRVLSEKGFVVLVR